MSSTSLPGWLSETTDLIQKYEATKRPELGEAKWAELVQLAQQRDQQIQTEYLGYMDRKNELLRNADPSEDRADQHLNAIRAAAKGLDPVVGEKVVEEEQAILLAASQFKKAKNRFTMAYGSPDRARQRGGAAALAADSMEDFDSFLEQWSQTWQANKNADDPEIAAHKTTMDGTDLGLALQYTSMESATQYITDVNQGVTGFPSSTHAPGEEPEKEQLLRAADRVMELENKFPDIGEKMGDAKDEFTMFMGMRDTYLTTAVHAPEIAREMVAKGEAEDYSEAFSSLTESLDMLHVQMSELRAGLPEVVADVKMRPDAEVFWVPPSMGEIVPGADSNGFEYEGVKVSKPNFTEKFMRGAQNQMAAALLPLMDALSTTVSKEEMRGLIAAQRPQTTDPEKRRFLLIPTTPDAIANDLAFFTTMAPQFKAGSLVSKGLGAAVTKAFPNATKWLAGRAAGRVAQSAASHGTTFAAAEGMNLKDETLGERGTSMAVGGAAGVVGGPLVEKALVPAVKAGGRALGKALRPKADIKPTVDFPKTTFPPKIIEKVPAKPKPKTKADVEAAAKEFNKKIVEPEIKKAKAIPETPEKDPKAILNELSESVKKPKAESKAPEATLETVVEAAAAKPLAAPKTGKMVKPAGPHSMGSATPGEFFKDSERTIDLESVTKTITTAIREIKPSRKYQDALNRQERGIRSTKMKKIPANVRGSARLGAMNKIAKGELPKHRFESLRQHITEEQFEWAVQEIATHPRLAPYERLAAANAFKYKLFGKEGAEVPQAAELEKLERVFGPEFTRAISDRFGMDHHILAKILGSARVLRSMDLASAWFRQGMPMLFHNPRAWGRAAKNSMRYLKDFNEVAYKERAAEIVSHPKYKDLKEGGLSLPLVHSGKFGQAEEELIFADVMEHLGEQSKSVIIRKGAGLIRVPVKMSDRSYNGFLSDVRWGSALDLVKAAEIKKGSPLSKKEFADIADFVNTFSGRGSIRLKAGKDPKTGEQQFKQKNLKDLADTFFSPRLQIRSLRILSPTTYIGMTSPWGKFVRQEALKTTLRLYAGVSTALFLASQIPGVFVTWDTNNADFGKLRIGKLRIDMTSGLGSWFVLFSRLASRSSTSSVTGKKTKLEDPKNIMSRNSWDLMLNTGEMKTAPVPSLFIDLAKGTDFEGRNTRTLSNVLKTWTPMFLEDMAEIAHAEPNLWPYMAASQIGFGTNVYPMWTTRAMDNAKRIVVNMEANEEKSTSETRRFEKAYSALKKAMKEEDDEKVKELRAEADRLAKAVVAKEGWRQ